MNSIIVNMNSNRFRNESRLSVGGGGGRQAVEMGKKAAVNGFTFAVSAYFMNKMRGREQK